MKQTFFITGAAIVALLSGCTKPVPDPVEAIPTQLSTYGVSVREGRLHFATIQDFHNSLQTVNEESDAFSAYVEKLEGFTSKREAKQMNKSGDPCNCDINDEYAISIVNSHNMLDVGEWTVKLNGCNQRYYAMFRRGLTASQITSGISALEACDFNSSHHFYEISNEYELDEELSILEEVFAGDPDAGDRRCKDVVCSDRMDVSWADTYNPWGSVLISLPETRLFYNKGWVKGAISIYAFDDGSDLAFQLRWFYEVYNSQFREKCGDLINMSARSNLDYGGHRAWVGGPAGTWWQDQIYRGPRLKAGEGGIKAKSFHQLNKLNPDHNFYWETPELELVF